MLKKIIKMIFKNETTFLNLFFSLLNFLIFVLLSKILNRDQFGIISLLISYDLLIFSFFGIKNGDFVLKLHSDNKLNIISLRKIILLDTAWMVVLFIVNLLVAFVYSFSVNVSYEYFVFISVLLLLRITNDIFENLFIIFNKLHVLYRIKLLQSFVLIALTYFLTINYSIIGSILALIFARFFYFISTILYVKINFIREIVINENIFSLNEYFKFMKYSFFSSTFKSGTEGLDIMLLGLNLDHSEIALYTVARKFSKIANLITGSFWLSKQSLIIKKIKEKDLSLINFLKKNISLLLLLGLSFTLIFVLFKNKIITILFGSNYIKISSLAIILFISFWVSNSFAGYARLVLIAINKIKILSFLNAFVFGSIIIGWAVIEPINIYNMSIIIIFTRLLISISAYFYLNENIKKIF